MPTPPSPITIPTSLSYRSVVGRSVPLSNLELDGNFAYLENLAEQRLPIISFTAANIISKLNADVATASPGGLNVSLLRGFAPTVDNTGNTVVLRNSNGDFYANTVYAVSFNGVATSAIRAYSADRFTNPARINGVAFNGTTDITVADNTKVSKSGDTIYGKLNLRASLSTGASLNIPHGDAPQTIANGDIWTTVQGQYNVVGGVVRQVAYMDSSIRGTASNVTGVVQISNGGTGATESSAARSNIGAAASGNNTDITRLSGLTTPLSPQQGGTGLTTSGAAGNVLTSDGNGMWVSAPQTGVPSGAVMAFAMSTPPNGWLECDGTAISRIVYASLFNSIGTSYGAGNGSTTFNLPDLRGEFVRGWDHGRGVDAGRTFGSQQSDGIKSHSHPIRVGTSDGSAPYYNYGLQSIRNGSYRSPPNEPFSLDTGGTETRPRNIALMYCIKI